MTLFNKPIKNADDARLIALNCSLTHNISFREGYSGKKETLLNLNPAFKTLNFVYIHKTPAELHQDSVSLAENYHITMGIASIGAGLILGLKMGAAYGLCSAATIAAPIFALSLLSVAVGVVALGILYHRHDYALCNGYRPETSQELISGLVSGLALCSIAAIGMLSLLAIFQPKQEESAKESGSRSYPQVRPSSNHSYSTGFLDGFRLGNLWNVIWDARIASNTYKPGYCCHSNLHYSNTDHVFSYSEQTATNKIKKSQFIDDESTIFLYKDQPFRCLINKKLKAKLIEEYVSAEDQPGLPSASGYEHLIEENHRPPATNPHLREKAPNGQDIGLGVWPSYSEEIEPGAASI